MIVGLHESPPEVEVARFERECQAKIAAKMASAQLGEAFVGLDDRRHAAAIPRGADRREWTGSPLGR